MTRVALLFGGISTEHDISCTSADNVINALNDRFDLVLIGITREGRWVLCPSGTNVTEGGWEADATLSPVVVLPGRGLAVAGEKGELRPLSVDIAFPVLHGQGGEDGTLQGALEVAGVPYVGCGVMASAVCMDKDAAHRIAAAAGVRSPRCEVLRRGCTAEAREAAVSACGGFPVFVKPARGGSSIGVSRAEDAAAYAAALDVAFALDEKVAVEEAITGVEVGCAITGDAVRGTRMGEVDEIVVSGNGFFRIHLEDDPGANTQLRCPSELSEDLLARVRAAGTAVYEALGCEGLARVDLFVTPEGEVVFNEVNSMPGLTYYSRFPQMMSVAGHELGDVLAGLIADRLSRA
ncbi:D-alanine--D-alanine ligase family protein [Thermophilibacter provencensis]|uniref:D-alanine--D-alanine ligase n=1 Tax=Thermophilibacter provencensis TaxID=1852386 RepID=A0ABT7V3B8_9ACTN|nr:D-alanine--D-alanine ligase family protein [Thermophilibacter provencensis]MDM8270504.1 D-alanine--D-alanine ligase family protein [Thermophilibacter provencensis]